MSNRDQRFIEKHFISQKSSLGPKLLIFIGFGQSEKHGFEAKLLSFVLVFFLIPISKQFILRQQ